MSDTPDAAAPDATAPVLLNGAVPSSGASTSLSLPRQDWWEKWWDLSATTQDTAKLQSIFGKDFDPATSLRTYITTSNRTDAVIWAAFQLTPRPRKGGPNVMADLVDAKWQLDKPIQVQERDPTYALGILLDIPTLRDMARQCVPVKALFFRVPDDLAKSASDFRTDANIPPCAGLRINAPPKKADTAAAAAKAKKASDAATAKADKSPDDADARAAASGATSLSNVADENAAVTAQSAATVDDMSSAKAAQKKADIANKKHPSDDNRAALDAANQAVDQAQAALRARANDNLVGGWMYMGDNHVPDPQPPDSAGMDVKRMYWAERKLFREGGWNAINTYDGTFTYGSGWNMTSGEGDALLFGLADPSVVILRKPEADDAVYVSSFTAGCANVCTYLKKCGLWFDDQRVVACSKAQNNMRILHIDTSGGSPVGYVVDNAQLCREQNLGLGGKSSVMGNAYRYLSMNRRLIEALIRAGTTDPKLPQEDTVPDGTRMAAGDVMRTVQLRLFEVNRMKHFGWWAACATQGLFFLLVHANHFGGAYAQNSIIQFGITSKLVPAVTSDASPGPGYVKLAAGLWLLPSPATDVKIARAAMTYMMALGYKKKAHPTTNYDGSRTGYSVTAFFDLWTAFVEDIMGGHTGLGEPKYAAPAATPAPATPPAPAAATPAPAAATPAPGAAAADAGTPPAATPDAGNGPTGPVGPTPPAAAAFPVDLDPNQPEPVPLEPWRQWLEQAVPANATDMPAALNALETGAAKDWIVMRGRKVSDWQDVHYVTIPKSAAP
jgi:hypothetical protein